MCVIRVYVCVSLHVRAPFFACFHIPQIEQVVAFVLQIINKVSGIYIKYIVPDLTKIKKLVLYLLRILNMMNITFLDLCLISHFNQNRVIEVTPECADTCY